MHDTINPQARAEADQLRARALAAADQRDAEHAAAAAETIARRLDLAENQLHEAVRAVIGPDAYFAVVGEIDTTGPSVVSFRARVEAGDLTLMVERLDPTMRTSVTLMAECPDCGDETPYGFQLESLTDLGVALRTAEMPCLTCSQGRHPSSLREQTKPVWRIDKAHTTCAAEKVAAEFDAEGYEVFVRPLMEGDRVVYVVSGHQFDRPVWG